MAFNEAFKQQGLPHEWSEEKYGELLKIGGGKERMHAYFSECASEEPYKSISEPEDQKKFLKDLHLTKTRIFQRMVQAGKMPLRPGVKELVGAPQHFLSTLPAPLPQSASCNPDEYNVLPRPPKSTRCKRRSPCAWHGTGGVSLPHNMRSQTCLMLT